MFLNTPHTQTLIIISRDSNNKLYCDLGGVSGGESCDVARSKGCGMIASRLTGEARAVFMGFM